MPTALLYLVATLGADPMPVAERLYDGATYLTWAERVRHVQPGAPGSEKLVPGLVALVRDREVPGIVRKEAALLLGRIGPRAADAAVPELIRALGEPDRAGDSPRSWAAKSLTYLGPRASTAAPTLIAIARNPRESLLVRQWMLEPLAAIGPAHPDVLPFFVELLRTPTGDDPAQATLVETAADVAALLGRHGDPLAPLLVRALRDPRSSNVLRRNAAFSLGRIKPLVEIAAPALAEAVVRDTVDDVRDMAAESLGRLGPDAVAVIQQLFKRQDAATKIRALAAATQLKSGAKPLEAELRAAMRETPDGVRLKACETWLVAELPHDVAVDALADLVGSEDRTVRIDAAGRLSELGPKAASAKASLEKWAKDPRFVVRRVAIRVLQSIAEM